MPQLMSLDFSFETLRPAVLNENQSGCFALEEERGGSWMGSGVPPIKKARPTL